MIDVFTEKDTHNFRLKVTVLKDGVSCTGYMSDFLCGQERTECYQGLLLYLEDIIDNVIKERHEEQDEMNDY